MLYMEERREPKLMQFPFYPLENIVGTFEDIRLDYPEAVFKQVVPLEVGGIMLVLV